jgi:hypothetical protein
VLHARPRIRGNVLDIAPEEIEMFGTRFPAANVLAEVKAPQATFRLQKAVDRPDLPQRRGPRRRPANSAGRPGRDDGARLPHRANLLTQLRRTTLLLS